MNHPKNPIENFLYGKPGKASNYIEQFQADEGEIVCIFKRVSTIQQGKKKNLENQHSEIRWKIKQVGGKVSSYKIEIEFSGKAGPGYAEILQEIGNELRRRGIKKLVATSTDRFIRNMKFKSNDEKLNGLLPTDYDYLFLTGNLGEGIQPMTILHPDESPSSCRSKSIKKGIKMKKRKTQSHKEMEPIVKQMRLDHPNWSIKDISEKVNQPYSNVRI